MKKALMLCLTTLWCLAGSRIAEAGCLSAQAISGMKENFSQAAAFYRQGLYDKSLEAYDRILGSRFESANVAYNMGNCYFKKGQMGLALLYYERALKSAPRDREILFNRDLTISRIDGLVVFASGSALDRMGRALWARVTIDEMTLLVGFLYIAFLGLIISGLVRRSFSNGTRIILVFLALFFLLGSLGLYVKINHLSKDAIIIDKQVAAKFEPFEQATTFFEVREGTPVTLIESQESWVKIRRLDGKSGWVPRQTVELL